MNLFPKGYYWNKSRFADGQTCEFFPWFTIRTWCITYKELKCPKGQLKRGGRGDNWWLLCLLHKINKNKETYFSYIKNNLSGYNKKKVN